MTKIFSDTIILSLYFNPRLNGVTGLRLSSPDWFFLHQGLFHTVHLIHSLLVLNINCLIMPIYHVDFPEVGNEFV